MMIHEKNPYLFPNTGQSIEHVSGYNSVKAVATSDNISGLLRQPQLLIADKFRHRASTIFALQDVPAGQRGTFYRYMGHSEQINEEVYQCPLAIREITQVGGFLHSLDTHGKNIPTSQKIPSSTVTSKFTAAHEYSAEDFSVQDVNAQPSSVQDHRAQPSSVQDHRAQPSSVQDHHAQPFSVQDHHAQPFSVQDHRAQPSSVQDHRAQPSSVQDHRAQDQGLLKKTRDYVSWTSTDTETVSSYFETFITAKGTGTKGALPGKDIVRKFLQERNIFSGRHFSEDKLVKLVKTKVFNARTTHRKNQVQMFDPYKLWDLHAFIDLRNLIVARLTLFNARRGGEPARLLLTEWDDALKGVWIDPDMVEKVQDPIEKALCINL